MEPGTNPFFVEQQPNVLGLPPLSDHASPSSGSDMMAFEQADSPFPFVQDLPLPSFTLQSMSPQYVMHPIQPFKGIALLFTSSYIC